MKKITYFHLNSCPYCKNANKAIEELRAENPEYNNIEIDMIEENEIQKSLKSMIITQFHVCGLVIRKSMKRIYLRSMANARNKCVKYLRLLNSFSMRNLSKIPFLGRRLNVITR